MAAREMAAEHELRVVEFYAGVGGFHHSLDRASTPPVRIVASIDINTNTSAIYRHNFPATAHLNRNICGIAAQDLDRLRADVFVLSPPCQPFTRQGLRRDNLDRRTDSFFHLMSLLSEMEHPPQFLLAENVQGFESSHTREHFVGILKNLDFVIQEFLLSPAQFGVPNSRLRYYLLAKRKPLSFAANCSEQPCKTVDFLLRYAPSLLTANSPCGASGERQTSETPRAAYQRPPRGTLDEEAPRQSCETIGSGLPADLQPPAPASERSPPFTESCHLPYLGDAEQLLSSPLPPSLAHSSDPVPAVPLSNLLEPLTEDQLQAALVPAKILQRYAIALDIVQPSSRHSCCFTKAYGNYAVGTGSVLQHATEEDLEEAFRRFSSCQAEGRIEESVQALLPLKLRYFTPREVARLMCFPPEFSFPPSLSDRQCYKAMGNSLNVHVVATLMTFLFSH